MHTYTEVQAMRKQAAQPAVAAAMKKTLPAATLGGVLGANPAAIQAAMAKQKAPAAPSRVAGFWSRLVNPGNKTRVTQHPPVNLKREVQSITKEIDTEKNKGPTAKELKDPRMSQPVYPK